MVLVADCLVELSDASADVVDIHLLGGYFATTRDAL